MNKSNIIEYIENIYGLANNYLRNNKNPDLIELLLKLEKIENSIKKCDNLTEYKLLKKDLYDIFDRIEDIINE